MHDQTGFSMGVWWLAEKINKKNKLLFFNFYSREGGYKGRCGCEHSWSMVSKFNKTGLESVSILV